MKISRQKVTNPISFIVLATTLVILPLPLMSDP